MTFRRSTIRLSPSESLHAVESGQGRPIVLLHGAMATHHDWVSGPAQALAGFGRIIALDRPGHGLSERPRFRGTAACQAAQIRRGLAELGVSRPILVAHSFGCLPALAWAAEQPDEVAGLVLAAPLAFPEFRPVEHALLAPRSLPLVGPWLSFAARVSIDPLFLRTVQELMFSPQRPPQHWLDTFPDREVLAPEHMLQEGEDAASVAPGSPAAAIPFEQITAPVHILAGDRDKVVDPHRHARRLVRRLPGGRLEMAPGVGHMVHHAATDRLFAAVERMVDVAA